MASKLGLKKEYEGDVGPIAVVLEDIHHREEEICEGGGQDDYMVEEILTNMSWKLSSNTFKVNSIFITPSSI